MFSKDKFFIFFVVLGASLYASESRAADCSGVNEYPDWTGRNWDGGPYDHAKAGDSMVYQGVLYRANWYTTTVPGSDPSWATVGPCSGEPNPVPVPNPMPNPVPNPMPNPYPGEAGYYVDGRNLYDRCGEQVVLRGVNEMVVWSAGKDGSPEFAEIAKTRANSVRIVWTSEGSASELDTAIRNSLNHQMIPMIENHEATGELGSLPRVVDWWVRSDIVSVIKKYQQDLLVNIANESGDNNVNAPMFASAYKTAITRMRNAGIMTPLVIDAPTWGQDIDVLQATFAELIRHDPESNLLFSVHTWWNDPSGDRVRRELQESVNLGVPLIVGEFAQHAVYLCDQSPFDFRTLLTEAQRHSIGWYAWSWGGVDNADCANQGSFDMTTGGIFGNWEETWGQAVAVTHPASITATSIRPYSIVNGRCR